MAKVAKKNKLEHEILGVEFLKEEKIHVVELIYKKFALAPYINFNLRHIVLKATIDLLLLQSRTFSGL